MTTSPRVRAVVLLLAAAIPAVAWGQEVIKIPVAELGGRYQLVGNLHVPLGDVVIVQGIVVEGPFKGYEGGPSIRAQRIDGKAIQEDIQICVSPYFGKWGDGAREGMVLPKLEMGKTYEMRGYETGHYVGIPAKAYDDANVMLQTTGHYFHEEFMVYRAKKIDPVVFSPSDFADQKALLHGVARSEDGKSLMEGQGWTVIVDSASPWPRHVEGKQVETLGKYSPVSKSKRFTLTDGISRLVRLEDQVGRKVELRGRARSLNGVWWFRYRGVDLYVENMEKLPGWSADCHARPMVIRGVLETAVLPRLDQISLKADRDTKEYFIVRKASWEPLDALLGPERAVDEE